MKIRELIYESPTDIVARLYKEADSDYDRKYNTDAAKYQAKNKDYYDKHFADWQKSGQTPVFTKPTESDPHPFTNQPKSDREQSPGYRGLHRARKAAALPHDANARYVMDPTAIIAKDAINNIR